LPRINTIILVFELSIANLLKVNTALNGASADADALMTCHALVMQAIA